MDHDQLPDVSPWPARHRGNRNTFRYAPLFFNRLFLELDAWLSSPTSLKRFRRKGT